MNKLWILLAIPFLLGADYVCFDKKGNITQKVLSKGAAYSSRKDCKKVSREKIKTITSNYKHKNALLGSNDKDFIPLTVEEIAEKNKPTEEQVKKKDIINSLKTKLKGNGYTDEEISILLNNSLGM